MNPGPDCVTYVIVSCEDHAVLLPEAIDSVLNQEHCSIKLIVFLDWHNSLRDVAKLIGSRYQDDVKFITLDERVGKSIGFNTAFRYVRTRYLCFLDADDLICRNKTFAQLQFLKSNPRFSHCGTSFFVQEKKGGVLTPYRMDSLTSSDIYMGPLFLYSSLMIDLKKINFMGLDQSLNVAMDYKLSHELLMSSPGANLPDHLVIHRSFCSTNQFSPIKRASQLTSHSRILCDFAFSRLSPPDRYHLIVLFSLGLAISTSEPDSVLDRLLDDLGINNFGIQISAIQELLENIDNAVSPRYLNSFNEFSPSFRRLIFMASSFLVNLQR